MAANTCRLLVLALGVALCACDPAPSQADAAAPAPIDIQPSGPLAALEAPAGVVGFAGSNAPGRLFASMAQLGTTDPSRAVLAKIAARYGLSKPDILDLDKPMRVAVFDSKALVLLVGVKSREDLLAALPADRRAGEHGFEWNVGERSVHLGFVGESAAFSESAELLPRHRDFFAKLAGAETGSGASIVLQLDDKTVAAALGKWRDAWGAVHDVARAELVLDADKRDLRAALTLRPRAGTPLAELIARHQKRGGRAPALLSQLPAKPLVALGASVDPESEIGPTVAAWLLQTPARDATPAGDAALAEFSAATTGEVAVALHEHEPGGHVLSALLGLRDAKRARDAARRARAVYAQPQVIEAMQRIGARLMFQPNAYMLGSAPVDMVTAIETEPPAGSPVLPVQRALGTGASAFFALMSSHMTLDGDRGIATFGEHARMAMVGWRTRPRAGGPAFSDAIPGLFAVAQLWPARVVAAGDGEAVVLTAAAHRAALELRLLIPRGETARLDQALVKLRNLL